MAIFYASTSGSNTAPYDTMAKGAINIQTAINALANDGDEVVIDDEAWSLTTAISDSAISVAADSSFIIRSLSGDKSLCSVNANATGRQINLFNNATTYNWLWQGFTFKNTSGFTAAGGGGGGRYFPSVGNVDYEDCAWNDLAVSGSAVLFPWLIRQLNASKTLTMTRCNFNSGLSAVGISAALMASMVFAQGNIVLTDVAVDGVNVDQQANNQACLPLFRCKGDLTVLNIEFKNNVKTCPDGSSASNWALLSCDNAGKTNTVDGFTFFNNTVTGGLLTGGMLTFTGAPFTVSNGTVSFCTATDTTTNGVGCGVTATGDASQGTIDNYTAHDNEGLLGTGIYMSQGAGVVVTNFIAYNNTALGRTGLEQGYGGACTFGGWGDCTINYALIYNNTSDEGGGISSHVHGSATRAPTRLINNVTAFGNIALKQDTGAGGNNMFFSGGVLAFPQTATVKNCITWDGNGDEIFGEQFGTGLVLTVDHCDIEGGVASTTNVDFYTNNINADPLFADVTRGNFRILKTSPCRDTGTDVGLTHDITGQVVPVNNIPDIGAYEIKLSMLANGSCASGDLFSGINRCKGNASGNLKGEL